MKFKLSRFFHISLFLLSLSVRMPGQQVLVERCKLLDQTSPIHNIWVDDDNIKWVANSNGLNKVLALTVVEKVNIPSGTTSLLTIRGGNAQLEWNTAEMQQLIGNVNVTCATYDPKTKTIWLGTKESGAIQVTLSPLRIVQKLNTDNHKLTSNQINDIFITTNGTTYIATDDGMLIGSGDKWVLQERYLNFVGVDAYAQNLWILGDDFLWQVDSKGKWSPIAIELKNVEGQLRDIAVDDEGRVWIASNMMTGYDVAADKYQRFGPGQYFTSQFVNCLDVDKDGSIWTGTNDKGLYLIQWESSMIVTINMDNPPDCNSSQPTASLSVKVAGGAPPYTYAWNSGQTTSPITNLSIGEYILTVTDAKGATKTVKYPITDPAIKVTATQVSPSSGSAQGDGSANIVASGGSGQYIIQWDNGEATMTASKLTSGAHAVTVTDKSGCSAVANITINETVLPLSVTIATLKDNKCTNTKEGQLKAEVKGGKGPFQYAWSVNAWTDITSPSLGPGTYSVSVSDAAGQKATATATLKELPAFVATIELIIPASVNAPDGQAQVKSTGGKSPYTYLWSNGEKNLLVKTLSAGTHTVTVTDANGCTTMASLHVIENIQPINASITQVNQINCFGSSAASLQVNVKGGKGPFQYKWSNGQSVASIQDLPAGTYTVTVTDVAGSTTTTTVTIPQPQLMNVSIIADAAASTNGSDGKATAKATGGTPPFQYQWDNGENINKATKLNGGIHKVTVTDAAGCISTGEVNISENILALQVSIEQKSIIHCAGAAEANIEAKVSGGKAPFIYHWNNEISNATLQDVGPGLYTLTVTDVIGHTATSVVSINTPLPMEVNVQAESPASTNGSNGKAIANVNGGTGKYSYLWDNNEKTQRAEKLTAGNHSLTVTDENGCTAQGSVVITENILPLAAKITQGNKITCAGQSTASLNAELSGGKQPFTYSWSGPGVELTGESVTNLAAGTYTLKVTDAVGTVITNQFVITEPKPITATAGEIVPATTGNADGKVTINISGGTGPYSTTNTSSSSGNSAFTIDKLSPGIHKIQVNDAAGCTAEVSVNIPENILPLAVKITQGNKITCAGQSTASLKAELSGGKQPFTYSWSGAGKEFTGESINNLAAGPYTLKVTDVTGTSATNQFVIAEPKPLVATAEQITPASTGNSDGEVTIKITGGTGPYSAGSASAASGGLSFIMDKLSPGVHNIVVNDAAGCSAEVNVTITENILPLSVSIKQSKQIQCGGNAEANLEASVRGGKPPYNYSWNNGQNSSTLSSVAEGNYTLNVTDASGLKGSAEFTIKGPEPMKAEVTNQRSATNDRINDGKGTIQVKGGTGPFTYKWSSGETTAQASHLPLGNGEVIVTDQNGCSSKTEYTISQKVLPELTAARLSSGEPIRMEKIQFEADSVKIYPEAIPTLDELYDFLYDNPTMIIEVSGHTNGLPADDYCDRISSERAQSVASYLIDKGIEPRRVISKGYGKRKPIATNQTLEGRKRNQRVEIRLIKIEE